MESLSVAYLGPPASYTHQVRFVLVQEWRWWVWCAFVTVTREILNKHLLSYILLSKQLRKLVIYDSEATSLSSKDSTFLSNP